jgi:DNA mismatch repair ATPase MutS
MQQRQLELYKKLSLNPGLLSKSQEALFNDDKNLVQSLKQLAKIQNRMDFRMNLLVGTVLNFYLAWDYHVIHQWNHWKNENQSNLGQWERQLAQLEVWISGAVYRFNFPETCFAQFSENEGIKITGLGHPFVHSPKRISNNVEMTEDNHFLIITGPNMAGKSTYLRSLGLAFICANAGFPILAKRSVMPRMSLYSSMRTTDDLTVESSYFHAELTRLRFIMDAIERGEKVFIILDEILKGTNSKDKEIGSAKFLEKLKSMNAKGVIATHDLSLCNLAENNLAYKNWYFDSTIKDNELSFDYKIRSGVCQNMNASFLLKKMNLVD